MNETLHTALQRLAASSAEINLLNVFQGVSLSFPAKVLEVGPETIRVQTNRYQAVCMYVEKRTFLQSKALPEIYRADVLDLDARECSVTLAHFRPVESTIGKRTQVRVAPRDSIDGNLRPSGTAGLRTAGGLGALRAVLADISQDGLGIYLIRDLYTPQYFARDAAVMVTLRLPGTYEESPAGNPAPSSDLLTDRYLQDNVRFNPVGKREGSGKTGSLVRKLENPEVTIRTSVANTTFQPRYLRYRIGLRIAPNDPPRPLIAQFIARRQSEIIREITTLYSLLVEKGNTGTT